MNAYELADIVDKWAYSESAEYLTDAANMLRQQADRIAKLEQALQSIANERIELSHDKIKWQCEDHIKWAKEALK